MTLPGQEQGPLSPASAVQKPHETQLTVPAGACKNHD